MGVCRSRHADYRRISVAGIYARRTRYGIDTDSINVDSNQFLPGNISLQAFNSDNELASFDGAALIAELDTTELSMPDQNRFYANNVRPLVEGTDQTVITLQVGKRNRLTENSVFGTAKSLNNINGEFSIRENARYQRYRFNISGGFNHGNGAKVNVRRAGRR